MIQNLEGVMTVGIWQSVKEAKQKKRSSQRWWQSFIITFEYA